MWPSAYLQSVGKHLKKKLKIGRMEKIWVIAIAIIVFLAINFIFYKAMNGYYKREFGKKMWKLRGNKVYFWQGSIFVSTAGTFLVMYFLKYLNILTF